MMDFFPPNCDVTPHNSVGKSYLGQVVHRIQDVLLELELVLHQFTCQAALRLATGVHHFAAHTDASATV